MFDKSNDCVYFISKLGIIILEIDYYFGFIIYDNNIGFFILDFEKGMIFIFD